MSDETVPTSGSAGPVGDNWQQILFEDCPLPMCIYDRETLAFLAVNDAMVRVYGYSRDEFRRMKITDIRPPEDVPRLLEIVASLGDGQSRTGNWRHRKRDGTIIHVEIISHGIQFQGRHARVVLVNDVTDRKRIELALRESEERYRLMIEAVPSLAWRTDAAGGATDVNERWLAYTGQTAAEVRGNGWMEALHPDDRARVLERVRDDVSGGTIYQTEYHLRRAADGAYRWHLARALPVRAEDGSVRWWFGCAVDIHDQKMAHAELERDVTERTAALQASEERYRQLVELAPAGILVTLHERIAYVNPEAAHILGARDPAEILGRPYTDFQHPAEWALTAERLRLVMERGQPAGQRERRIIRLDGATRQVFASTAPVIYQGERAALTVLRDVTEMRRLEQEITEVSHREQARIGQELHDSVCQQLVGIAFGCVALQHALAGHAPALSTQAAEIERLVQQVLTETRALAHGLAPLDLGGQDLAVALDQLAKITSRLFPAHCVTIVHGQVERLSNGQGLHLYRIAQEAISNAIRHGRATEIRLELSQTPASLTLHVCDNGMGLAAAAASQAHGPGLGLPTMRYRAQALGATLTVAPADPGPGTVVSCEVPLPTAR